MDKVLVRRAKFKDYPDIKEIQLRGYGILMWNRFSLILQHIAGGREYIVEYDGLPVGFLHLRNTGFNRRHIINLCILPSHQDKGIGTHILDWVKQLNVDEGVQDITLHVRSSNKHVVDWYIKQGFVEMSRVVDYYNKPLDDGLRMRYRS